MKYAPGGHSSFFGFINSFVHIPMYLYYGLAAIGPHMNKYLFWKKYMTSLQMVNRCLVHSFRSLIHPLMFFYCFKKANVLLSANRVMLNDPFYFEGFRAGRCNLHFLTFLYLPPSPICLFYLPLVVDFFLSFTHSRSFFLLCLFHVSCFQCLHVSNVFFYSLSPLTQYIIDSIRCHFRALISIAISRL